MTRELEPESRAYTPLLRSNTVAHTSHRVSESCLGGRALSPSFLDLTPLPGYQPPEYNSQSDYNSPSEYLPPFEYQSPSEYLSPFEYQSPSAYRPLSAYQSPSTHQSPLAICVSTSSCIKRTKRKPPPLILNDSFYSTTNHQSPTTLTVPPNDTPADQAPLTPLSPFTPVSPRYRMPSEKEQFRRRLLKLQRTLGEQITPGLIIRPKTNPEPTSDLYRRTGSSFNSTPDYLPTKRSTVCAPTDKESLELDPRFSKNLPLVPPNHQRKSSAPVPSSPSFHSQQHYLPEPVTLTPMTLTAFAGSVRTPRNVTPTARSVEFVLNCDVQDSSSEDDGYEECPPVFSFDDDSCPPSPSQSDQTSSDDGDIVIVDLPYWTLGPNPSQYGVTNMPGTPGVIRREHKHGWSGEWNQPHIRDVIEKLRSL